MSSKPIERPLTEPWRWNLAGSVSAGGAGWLRRVVPFVATDACAVFTAAAFAVVVRYLLGGTYTLSFYLRTAPVILLFLISYATFGLYSTIALHPVAELQGVFRGTSLAILLLGAITFFQRDAEAYSRAILLASWILIIAAVSTGRILLRRSLARCEWWGEPAVILGAGPAGRAVLESLRQHPGASGLRPVAILDDDPARLESLDAPVTAPLDAASLLAARFGIRCAIVAMPDLPGRLLADILEQHAARFHHVYIIPDLAGVSSLGVDARELGGMLGVRVSHRLLQRAPRLAKRAIDILAAGALIVFLGPLFALLCLLIRATSRGPVLFGHRRLGAGGQAFTAWKFRTMRHNAGPLLERALAEDPVLFEEWRRDQKLRRDPRVTWIGRILRHTSIDELPQLWNVLRGDMSLVGPRPIIEAEVARYGARYALYQKVRPGLSGLWQVSGRNNLSYEERVRLDEYYVRNWSIWLDLYILTRTVKVVLTADGAY